MPLFAGSYTYPKLVFKAHNGHSLLSAETIREICRIDDEHTRYFSKFNPDNCPSHNLGFYISLLSSKPCLDITDEDVDDLLNHLRDCIEPYSQGKLEARCYKTSNCISDAPEKCHRYSAVFNIFEFPTDREFYSSIMKTRSCKRSPLMSPILLAHLKLI